MARRKDIVVEEVRSIRRRISRRLLEAEQRKGTCLPELRRMEHEAMKVVRRNLNGHASNGGRKAT